MSKKAIFFSIWFFFLLVLNGMMIYINMDTSRKLSQRPIKIKPAKMVLAASQVTPTVIINDTPTPIESGLAPTASPSPTIRPLQKKAYTIAIIGDSMVDTMGENLEYLQKNLQGRYPATTFHYYNYGIGGQNVTQGLSRFDSPFSYKTRNYPPISQISSDILIVASFAYNPFAPHDRNRHWSELSSLVSKAKVAAKQVYLLAEIAPLKKGFGKGPHGVNWPEDQAYTHALHIIEQLENAQNLARELQVPLIDAFTLSKVNGNFGNPAYVSSNDGIHPSVAGEVFMANVISSTIVLH